jgi:hypothetical protein
MPTTVIATVTVSAIPVLFMVKLEGVTQAAIMRYLAGVSLRQPLSVRYPFFRIAHAVTSLVCDNFEPCYLVNRERNLKVSVLRVSVF